MDNTEEYIITKQEVQSILDTIQDQPLKFGIVVYKIIEDVIKRPCNNEEGNADNDQNK